MLTLNNTPMAVITQSVSPCFVDAVAAICTPCRQLTTYLPLIKDHSNNPATALKALATAFLKIDDELMDKICGVCFTADTDDCECLLTYGRSVGARTYYTTIDATNCMRFGYTETVAQCCAGLVCTKQVFAYCQQLCEVCNVHTLDVCNNPADFEMYKRIVKFRAKWFNKAPTRRNIVDSLVDWFGSEAYVVDARYPSIFWSLGRAPTEAELAIMPFVYSMMPLYDGIDMVFTEEL